MDRRPVVTFPRRALLRLLSAASLLGALPLLTGSAARPGPGASGPGPSSPPDEDFVEGWLPAPPAMPGSVLVVDCNGLGVDTQVAMAMLQGIVNARLRRGGRGLYLLLPSNYQGGQAFQGADARWLAVYEQRFGLRSQAGSPGDALDLARQAGVRSFVVWDPALPATINVANTLAWLHGALAVAPADAGASGLNPPRRGFRRLLDLRSQGFADADAAYRWMLGQLTGAALPGALALLSVGDLPTDATERVIRWTPRDYAVATRAFCWIGRLGAGVPPVLGQALGPFAGRRATAFGWTNDEAAQTIIASSHGLNFVGADTPGLPAENLSVHAAMRPGGPASAGAIQRPRPAPPPLDPNGIYAAIVVTDGDNSGVLIDFHEGRWLDPARGTVPVGWSMQGMAPQWLPGIAAHYFDTATDRDEMVSWLPFGYPDLPSFVGAPNWSAYTASARAAMSRARLAVGQSLPHTGAVLTARASGLWDLLHGPDAPDGFFLGYTFIGGYPAGQALWVNARPVFPMGAFGGTGPTQADRAISAIANAIGAVSHRPLFVMVGLDNGTTYADAMRVAQATYREPVRFVLPGQLVALAKTAWTQGLDRAAPLGSPAAYGVRDTYFLLSAGDSGAASASALYLRRGVVSEMRFARDGGSWRYAFDVEGVHRASAEVVLSGAGTVEVSSDGETFRPAASVAGAWGAFSVATLDLSPLLPAEEVVLRFTAAAASLLGVPNLDLWHNRVLPTAALPATVQGATGAALGMELPPGNPAAVGLTFGTPPGLGLFQVGAHEGDSDFHLATVGGRTAAVFDPNTASPTSPYSYLYFVANIPGWTFPQTLRLTVSYYDQPAGGHLLCEYDTPGSGIPAAYTSAGGVQLGGTGAWKTHTFTLANADLLGHQNYGADFRLDGTAGVAVSALTLSRTPPASG